MRVLNCPINFTADSLSPLFFALNAAVLYSSIRWLSNDKFVFDEDSAGLAGTGVGAAAFLAGYNFKGSQKKSAYKLTIGGGCLTGC